MCNDAQGYLDWGIFCTWLMLLLYEKEEKRVGTCIIVWCKFLSSRWKVPVGLRLLSSARHSVLAVIILLLVNQIFECCSWEGKQLLDSGQPDLRVGGFGCAASDLFWIRHFSGMLNSTAWTIIALESVSFCSFPFLPVYILRWIMFLPAIFLCTSRKRKVSYGFDSFWRYGMIGTHE